MILSDLFDLDEFNACVDAGLIYRRPHPTEPLVIYNYTQSCQYERAWNACTTQCRGLIATEEGEVVARPFSKFFNYGEPDAPELDLLAPARVTDKLDGSLGILYTTGRGGPGVSDPYGYGWMIATRGSFESEQAKVATEMLEQYIPRWQPLHTLTYLFEIVYPENRIVIDYGQMRDLFLLAVIDNRTGRNYGVDGSSWPGPTTHTLEYDSLAAALLAKPRKNAEGLVVEIRDSGARVKLKQDDYVALHRLVTGLNERVVWEQLGSGTKLADLKAPMPEEFHDWIQNVAFELQFKADFILHTAQSAYDTIVEVVSGHGEFEFSRKEFALAAQRPEFESVKSYLFTLLDGKDPKPAIWKSIRPAGNLAPRDFAEAA